MTVDISEEVKAGEKSGVVLLVMMNVLRLGVA